MDESQAKDKMVEFVRSITSTGQVESLTNQSNKLSEIDEELKLAHEKAQVLISSILQVKSQIDTPYEQFVHRLLVLKRLVTTCDTLRSVIRLLQLSKKIQQRAGDTERRTQREAVKTRQLVQEFESILKSNSELIKIKLVEKEERTVNQIKAIIFN